MLGYCFAVSKFTSIAYDELMVLVWFPCTKLLTEIRCISWSCCSFICLLGLSLETSCLLSLMISSRFDYENETCGCGSSSSVLSCLGSSWKLEDCYLSSANFSISFFSCRCVFSFELESYCCSCAGLSFIEAWLRDSRWSRCIAEARTLGDGTAIWILLLWSTWRPGVAVWSPSRWDCLDRGAFLGYY